MMRRMTDHEQRWQEVGKAIRARIDELGLTKAEVIASSGVSDKSLKSYLEGQPIKRQDKARELSKALGWTPDSITRLARGDEPVVTFLAPHHGSSLVTDEKHETFLRALRGEVGVIVDDLSWDSVMAVLGTAAWLFHLERAAPRQGITDPGYVGIEDFLDEWGRYGDIKELNDLARSRVERRLAQMGGRVRPVLQAAEPAKVTRLAAKSGKTAAAGELTKAAKSTRKHPSRPKPPAEDDSRIE